MTKRRDIVKKLKDAGFKSIGGTSHEIFIKGEFRTAVARHHEIKDDMAKVIYKQGD